MYQHFPWSFAWHKLTTFETVLKTKGGVALYERKHECTEKYSPTAARLHLSATEKNNQFLGLHTVEGPIPGSLEPE